MKYLSICSGIEAASVAWEPLGWKPVAFAEIEKFPSAVLAHHWPDVPNLGDMTKHNEWTSRINPADVDVLVGGTPCQSFSVAGLRRGLEDPRGNLTLTFLSIVEQFQPTWLVWENVPGVLSDKGNAFGQFVAGLAELGYDCAWRVLDAQHFGVPQRRRRVFLVGCPRGSGHHPAEVLFEPESLRRDLTPSREAREVAPTIPSRSTAVGGLATDFDLDGGLVPEVANPLTARMHKGINTTADEGQTAIPVAFHPTQDPISSDDGTTHAMGTGSGQGCSTVAVAFEPRVARNGRGAPSDVVPPLKAQSGQTGKGDAAPCVATSMQVRRLTPTECERLQGFPDSHTRISWRGKDASECPDGPRYKALGNSMAIPVVSWIGKRIWDEVERRTA